MTTIAHFPAVEPATSHREWWERRSFVVAMVLLSIVPLLLPHPAPLVDLLGHIGRYRVQLDVASSPLLQRYYEYDWAPIGIKVERAPSPASADLIWIDEVAPSTSPAWFLRRFRCGVVAICVEKAEPLLAEARATVDGVQRASLFIQAAQLIDRDQIFVPIAAPIRWSLVSGRSPGFTENAFARHTLVGLANERFSDSR